ncbi:MAG: glycosyltransferase [Pseudomonadota bacterium]
MKILTLTTLYPNAATPNHGVFVENRLRAFKASSDADIRVVAPVPWFPATHPAFGRYASFARAPRAETRFGIAVDHPRYLIPPKIGMRYAPYALERAFISAAEKLRRIGWDFDAIDAHYLYPDGVAAVRAATRLGVPVVVTARGTDVHRIPDFPKPRRDILQAIYSAAHVICVADALKQQLVALGAPAEKISVLRNGVDLETFRPVDPSSAKHRLKLENAPLIVSVGQLIERKGHDVLIRAIATIPGAVLAVIGDGPDRAKLKALAEQTGVGDRVRFTGAVPHADLPAYYSAASALALASANEGWPNVLLEAMACGAPVIAAPVGGCSEVVASSDAGAVTPDRTPEAFARAIRSRLAAAPSREATRAYAENYSWRDTARRLQTVFDDAIARAARPAPRSQALQNASAEPPRLLITIDTEEAFDWRQFSAVGATTPSPDGLARLQAQCDRYGARPLYFLTQMIMDDHANRTFFSALQRDRRADLGLHLHQWTTAPDGGFEGAYYSFQKNLPRDVYAAKLNALANRFEAAFGLTPRSHRAGRYGIDASSYDALAAVGVDMDFSPSPGFDQSAEGGPDFTAMSNAPFAMQTDNAPVFVTPVAGARAVKRTRMFLPQSRRPAGFHDGDKSAPPATTPMRLTCENTSLADLKALTRALIRDGTRVLTFSLHSTSLTPGGNPYARDAADVDRMLALTGDYCAFFRDEIGGAFTDLDALRADYQAQSGAQTRS